MMFLSRLFIAIPMIVFGLFHFMNANGMVPVVPSFIPGGIVWVYFTGAALILSGAAILTQVKAYRACLGLAVMIGIFILTIHLPAYLAGDARALMALLKDLAVVGGVLALSVLFQDTE
ncbi:DoxX family protein [bacterium]|nr:DoxX family protein [bacterium]|tara:strand:- start:843 stop:1196 length:354 start_codon:yes stop_codon:yes gene_type:complete